MGEGALPRILNYKKDGVWHHQTSNSDATNLLVYLLIKKKIKYFFIKKQVALRNKSEKNKILQHFFNNS